MVGIPGISWDSQRCSWLHLQSARYPTDSPLANTWYQLQTVWCGKTTFDLPGNAGRPVSTQYEWTQNACTGRKTLPVYTEHPQQHSGGSVPRGIQHDTIQFYTITHPTTTTHKMDSKYATSHALHDETRQRRALQTTPQTEPWAYRYSV